MPIYESSRKRRERWPLAFDLEGVPRDSSERERLLVEQKLLEPNSNFNKEPLMQGTYPVQNYFAVDAPTETVVDINNPPAKRYVHQEFPKMVYHHDSGHVLTVNDEKELKAAVKRGFKLKPSPAHDYSQIKSGKMAPMKEVVAEREQELSAADMRQEDENDEDENEDEG